jgi:iron complex outermembrane receptor protein
VGIGTLACGAAVAQPAGGVNASASADTLEEIVVTAERREQDISKVPEEVTAVTSQDLADNDVQNASQLQYLVPSMNVSYGGGRGINISIRGVNSADSNNPIGSASVQYSVDGITTSRPDELSIPFFDTQRVEVLEGPQGTLYGYDSTGGAINVITNAPELGKETASASVELGNWGTRRFQGMINIPLGDSWAFRAAGTANYRQGFIKLVCPGYTMFGDCVSNNSNNGNPEDENNQAGRLELLGKLTDTMRLKLTATIGKIGGVGYGDGSISINYDDNLRYGNIPGDKMYAAWNPVPSSTADHFEKFAAQFDADMGPVHLVYLGGYSNFQTNVVASAIEFGPPDEVGNVASEAAYRHSFQQYESTYHELRLSNSDTAAPVQWIE